MATISKESEQKLGNAAFLYQSEANLFEAKQTV
jgi:hypothetical protein